MNIDVQTRHDVELVKLDSHAANAFLIPLCLMGAGWPYRWSADSMPVGLILRRIALIPMALCTVSWTESYTRLYKKFAELTNCPPLRTRTSQLQIRPHCSDDFVCFPWTPWLRYCLHSINFFYFQSAVRPPWTSWMKKLHPLLLSWMLSVRPQCVV